MRFVWLSAFDIRSPQEVSAEAASSERHKGPRWWRCWEVYPIVLIAAFLRFYLIQTTELDGDQANIFLLAYNAVSQGHLVATSNIASVKIYNPPGIVYLLMIPAAFSANPLGGALLTAFLATLGVLLTYCLALRYYGRLTATIAALLYATSALSVFYSRFMWQQNLLLFFAPLFIFVLFRGAVSRRGGWFVPALFLLGLMIQLHASSIFYAAPLLVAWLVAPRTVRWRDLILGAVVVLLSYAPYVLWEFVTHFDDISILLHNTDGPPHFDLLALLYYFHFLNPLNALALTTASRLHKYAAWFMAIGMLMTILVLIGVGLVVWQILGIRSREIDRSQTLFKRLKQWWLLFSTSPYRSGLAILLAWQLPVFTLLRHNIRMQPHYLIMYMPGPYILVALLLTTLVVRSQRYAWRSINMSGQFAAGLLATLIIGAQVLGALSSVRDLGLGHFSDRDLAGVYYNDLSSLQNALVKADEIAQERHLRRIYIAADTATFEAFQLLTLRGMHTPVTVISSDYCALVPDLSAGPVLLLAGPYSSVPSLLSANFAQLSRVAETPRLGGPPFQMYTLSAPQRSLPVQETLGGDLQMLGSQTLSKDLALLTYWRVTHTLPEENGKLYSYEVFVDPPYTIGEGADAQKWSAQCTLTAAARGDYLVTWFRLAPWRPTPTAVRVQTFSSSYYQIPFGPLVFDTYKLVESARKTLVSSMGKEVIPLKPWRP
jgi:4-amino-4-deoxy-L-arabinose transferase-like glycosyltransferase